MMASLADRKLVSDDFLIETELAQGRPRASTDENRLPSLESLAPTPDLQPFRSSSYFPPADRASEHCDSTPPHFEDAAAHRGASRGSTSTGIPWLDFLLTGCASAPRPGEGVSIVADDMPTPRTPSRACDPTVACTDERSPSVGE